MFALPLSASKPCRPRRVDFFSRRTPQVDLLGHTTRRAHRAEQAQAIYSHNSGSSGSSVGNLTTFWPSEKIRMNAMASQVLLLKYMPKRPNNSDRSFSSCVPFRDDNQGTHRRKEGGEKSWVGGDSPPACWVQLAWYGKVEEEGTDAVDAGNKWMAGSFSRYNKAHAAAKAE